MKTLFLVLCALFIAQVYGQGQTSGGGTPGSGTVTSVGMSVPSYLSVSGSPVTSSGTLTVTSTLTDTLTKANVWTSIAATDTLFLYKVDQSGLTARTIYSKRKGGTSASLNLIRVRAGTAVTLRSSDIATATAVGFITPMETWGALQNATSLIGDEYYVVINAISGTATDISVQVIFNRATL